MGRIDGFRIQSSINNTKDVSDLNLKMPYMLRDSVPQHIRYTGVQSRDTICKTPEIEHYNNYNNAGLHISSADAKPATEKDVLESSIFSHELYSIYTKPVVDVFVSSVDHKPPLQFNRMFDPEVARITAYMKQGIQDYMAGKAGADEITKIIENAYRDILTYNISLGNTDGTDPHYNSRLLFDTQAHFAYTAGCENIMANNAEGAAYAKENYGMKPNQDGFTYYNSKYYFLNKELQEIGKDAIAQVAQKEGFDFYDVQGLNKNFKESGSYCFNFIWQILAPNVKIKNTGIAPPKDFIMFFTPQRFSKEAFDNGAYQIISANDPTRTDGHGGWDFYIKVPKGAALFKTLPFWLNRGTFTNREGKTFVAWDITKHINFNAGDDMRSRLKEFFAEYVNTFLNGDLIIWSNGTKTIHDVPFDYFFDENRKYNGSELASAVKQNDFVSNFEFRMF